MNIRVPKLSAGDRLDICDLITSYGVHHDNRDFVSLGDCFTEDATYKMEISTGVTHGPRQGRNAIVRQIREFKESQHDKRRHHISNIQISPRSTDEAEVLSYLLVSVSDDAGLSILTAGAYKDTVVRTQGGWKIAAKQLQLDQNF